MAIAGSTRPVHPTIPEIRFGIIQYLQKRGIKAGRDELKQGVHRLLATQFADPWWHVVLKNGCERWYDKIGWQLTELKNLGLIQSGGWGCWELTHQGRRITSVSQCA